MPKRRQPLRTLEQARLSPFEVAKFNRGYVRRSCSPTQPRPPHNQADILKFVRPYTGKENYEGSALGCIDGRSQPGTSTSRSKSRSPELTSTQTRFKRRRVVPSSDAEDYDYLSSDSSCPFVSPIKNVGMSEVDQNWHHTDRASLDDNGMQRCSNSVDIWNNKMSQQSSNELSDGFYPYGDICHDKVKVANGDGDDPSVSVLNEDYGELIDSEPILEVRATAESETASMDFVLESPATIGAATGTSREDNVPDTYAEDNQVDESVCEGQEDERRTRGGFAAVNDNCFDSISEQNPSYSKDFVGESSPEYEEGANRTPCIPSSEWSECESLHSDTEEPDGLAGLAYATPERKPMTFNDSLQSPDATTSMDCQLTSFRTSSVPSTQLPHSINHNGHESSPVGQDPSQPSRSLLGSTRGSTASQLKTKPPSLSNTQVSGSTGKGSQSSNIQASDNSYADHFVIGQSDCRIENSLLTDSVMFSLPLPPEMKLDFWHSTQLSDE
ncbi:hypothetical protein V1509DRAFT_559329 [Lipomyces kononenkoae]